MKTVPKQEFVDWLKSQPDNKSVNMNQSFFHDSCGCAMVQYGKEKGFDFFLCGFYSWNHEISFETSNEFKGIDDLIPYHCWETINTFGEIKKILTKQGL